MINIKDFSFTYPTSTVPALSDLDLDVPSGELCVVLGAGGAGKSTLAGVISGTIPHLTGGTASGAVQVNETTVANEDTAHLAAHVGLVMQNPFNQISGARFTVREELAFGLENLGVPRAEMNERVNAVMDELRLTHLRDRSPFQLSGGQQQLLAIGSVLVMRPAVVALDEPTSQLDAAGCDLVFTALSTLRQRGITVLLAEQRVERVAREADRVVVLEKGRVVATGTPDEVLAREELESWGIAPLRYTIAARRAAERHRWPTGRPLPVTLDSAAEGFGGMTSIVTAGGATA
ncbi:ABC transporter ATP-binding protein [Streptomyces sp. SDr-06]|uniref:energy-coupling factor ABC transporter ATP-binding protein n=1 Tax=Streptomyces sp. SDr-06 TaxID=2267702 RepID=UPI000DEA5816|nr:ABC transporter ATP-binding protein [Streptomyces sp. SDr-06]RCH64194.1 ABC transporter ATP-binding protein [Streptomyces sp. SDr-06]